ncbi:30S ribosomal protein S4 [Patescibacteria group bacterium]|nr:30S ribosomal protein S4 [Patescibacteria group bacterium]MBU2219404.1 30S ribosomal protein S4 [Patescibacteria group bacterium]MBU2263700.1 30S ribosomal protein S4 [Patescibacteria group bacterium]
MKDPQCKKCIRINEKLFLKGEKCYSAKCPLARKASSRTFKKRGSKHARKGLSEYGLQVREKQKIKLIYGIEERQISNYVKEVKRKKGDDRSAKLYEFLEMRLDNVVFRLGFFDSRKKARQVVSHNHIMINNRPVNIPSYRVKIGVIISIRPQSLSKGIFKDLDIKIKKYNPPAWIKLEKDKKTGEIVGTPLLSADPGVGQSLNSIIEFYSR